MLFGVERIDYRAITYDATGLHAEQAESVKPKGQQSNGDRYSITGVSTDVAIGKPQFEMVSHMQKWSHGKSVLAKNGQYVKSTSYADMVYSRCVYSTMAEDSTHYISYHDYSFSVYWYMATGSTVINMHKLKIN